MTNIHWFDVVNFVKLYYAVYCYNFVTWSS